MPQPQTHRPLDEQEKAIARRLIRNPRATDKSISDATGIHLRTVGRKRQKLEQAGLIKYWTLVDLGKTGTGEHHAGHLYIIRLRAGISYDQFLHRLRGEPGSTERLAGMSRETWFAESDGKLVIVISLTGANDAAIVQKVHEVLIPHLLSEYGANAIENISGFGLLTPVCTLQNYLPLINMTGSVIRDEWPDEAIHVGS